MAGVWWPQMKKIVLFVFCGVTFSLHAAPWATTRPKLVVVIVIDQFRADYISRFQKQFSKDGFMGLINSGAYFPYGEYDVLQSMTGPGHATILTGAYPYQMGIPLNEWYDQKTQDTAYCVSDPDTKLVGGTSKHPGSSSPKNLLGTTVGDEMKNADGIGKVVTLSLKDRAAILLGGHRADLAFWIGGDKRWVTSSYYRKDGKLPTWLAQHNQSMVGACDGEKPCGIEITAAAFNAALEGEHLGQSAKGTDILAVSFSSHDIAGHHFGPNAEEMRVMTLAEDRAIAQMRARIRAKVSLKDVLFILTGDHGVAPKPEYLAPTGIASGRVSEENLVKEMNELLTKKYGPAKKQSWVADVLDFNFFINEQNVRDAKLDLRQIENEMKDYLRKNPAFAHVVTRGDYEAHQLPPGVFERRVQRTFYPGRSGHVIALLKPFYINDAKNEANHMTAYTYDRMVPIVFSGFGIKNGLFAEKAEVVDIAPTLAFLLGVLPPALSEGRVLSSALK